VRIAVRLFSLLRERAGSDRVELQLEEGATVADALDALRAQPALGELLERLPVQLAVNRDYASPQTRLVANDELALIPPLSGGAGTTVHVAISERPLSVDSLSAKVADPRAGAIVTFQGVTREVARLDYEAYDEMAYERIAAIVRECAEAHELCAAAAEHRTGAVALGEPSVIVAASSPHREQAFAAAREMIDRIKAEAPIWKVEVEENGSVRRVAGVPAPGAQPPGQDQSTPTSEPESR
jgi:molybdopterin synthase catalytic subunit